jgi:hypothetical protein
MPSIEKSERREIKRRKIIDSKYQNIRYRNLRAGESLVAFEAARKTTVEGKPVKPPKRRKRP